LGERRCGRKELIKGHKKYRIGRLVRARVSREGFSPQDGGAKDRKEGG